MNGFRTAALNSGSSLSGWTNFGIGGGMGAGLPAPFDAVAGNRLIGPSGSHPLAAISLDELVQPMTNGLVGEFAINGPVRIGEAIAGRLTVTAQRDITARSAMVRLVGVLITEQRALARRNATARATSRAASSGCEVGGDTFEELPFSQPALPVQMTSGQTFEADFKLPAPRLGPVSAHMGSASWPGRSRRNGTSRWAATSDSPRSSTCTRTSTTCARGR